MGSNRSNVFSFLMSYDNNYLYDKIMERCNLFFKINTSLSNILMTSMNAVDNTGKVPRIFEYFKGEGGGGSRHFLNILVS